MKTEKTNNFIYPSKPREIVSWLREQPIDPGVWLALVKRQACELSLAETAAEIGCSVNRVSQLASDRLGCLKRSRRGFIKTISVRNYILKLQKSEVNYER